MQQVKERHVNQFFNNILSTIITIFKASQTELIYLPFRKQVLVYDTSLKSYVYFGLM